MKDSLLFWWRKFIFRTLFVPLRLFKGSVDLSVIWKKPKDPTFPYEAEKHGYIGDDDGCISFPLLSAPGDSNSHSFLYFDIQELDSERDLLSRSLDTVKINTVVLSGKSFDGIDYQSFSEFKFPKP